MFEALHLQELLHLVSQGLKYPIMLVLALLIIYAVWCIGSVLVEAIVERRHFTVSLPKLVADIDDAAYIEVPDVIEKSGLLRDHKSVLKALVAYGYLPEADLVALAKRFLAEAEMGYTKVTSRTDLVAKVSPMIGLMGTLVPLGPGIVAMGQGQTDLLAQSIEIAFDTTVAGLIVAAVALLVGRWRKRWYEDYMVSLESCMAAILQKADECKGAGLNIGDKQRAGELLEQVTMKGLRRKGTSIHAPGGAAKPELNSTEITPPSVSIGMASPQSAGEWR